MMEQVADAGNDCLVEVPIRLPLAEIERLLNVVDRARRSGMLALPPSGGIDVPSERLAAFAKFILGVRRNRDAAFPGVEFGEPIWDMLLDLYVQHVEGRKVSVSSLCAAAAVPTTTALRWIAAMTERGFFLRTHDPDDGRRMHIALAPDLLGAVEAFLANVRERAQAALR